jgi:hypothetical protein
MIKILIMQYKKILLLFLLSLCFILGLLLVYQNNFLRTKTNVISEFKDKFLSIQAVQKNDLIPIKLSIPYSLKSKGCEFNYGTVELQDSKVTSGNEIKFSKNNYLIRFKYDSKNSRCESKDFSIKLSQIPATIIFKIYNIEHYDDKIVETEFENTYKIEAFTKQQSIEIKINSILNKDILPNHYQKETNFSSNLSSNEVKIKFAPWESFGLIVKDQIKLHIDKCIQRHECEAIKYAISIISDPEVFELLEYAQKVGISVEGIINANSQISSFKNYHKLNFNNSPLMWLRGDKNLNLYKGILQMHTKFVIFGDNLVISSNQNLDKYGLEGSRGLTIEYHTPKVVSMFKSIYQIIKTGVPFPLFIKSSDNFQLLFNHYRPRSYIASAFKNYTPIIVDRNIVTNAYGYVLNEISNAKKQVQIFGSPISDACYNFKGLKCFFNILNQKNKENLLTIGLSGTFYLSEHGRNYIHPSQEINLKIKDNFEKFIPFIKDNPKSIKLFKENFSNYTSHHERYVVIKDSALIGGSANLVYKYSVNTVEIFKDNKIIMSAQDEIDTFDEPYIAFEAVIKEYNTYQKFKNCMFRIEKDIFSVPKDINKLIPLNLVSKIRKKLSVSADDKLVVVEPDAESNTPNKYFFKELVPNINIQASRICIFNQDTNQSHIVDIRSYD